MADSEVALDVDHLQAQKTQSSAVDGSRKLAETTATAKTAPKDGDGDGGDTRTKRTWPSFSTIFNPKGKFLPMWNHIFVATCVFAVSFDPLFFYIPVVKEREKCVSFDKRLRAIALVLRLLTDQFYVADIVIRFLSSLCKTKKPSADCEGKEKKKHDEAPKSKGKYVLTQAKRAWAKTNRTYILIDILAVLPIPQVGIFVVFSKVKGPRCLNPKRLLDTLVLLQFVPRVFPIYILCRVRKKTLNKGSMWTRGVFNFFLYILASHVVGALWYFFAIEREMDCWRHVCRDQKVCEPRTFICNERRQNSQKLRNSDHITLLMNTECPIIQLANPKQKTPFDFGIFSDALDSGIVETTNFPKKFLNCFWWGLKNLSSLGQNLDTSTYAWENLFAVFISITGLLLFIYLIGNMQFATTRSEKLRRKMKTKNLEVELWLSRKGLPSNLKEVLMRFIQQKLEENEDVHVENILDVLPSPHSKYIKRYLQLATLKKVPMLQTMGVKLLKGISGSLDPVKYTEESCIIEEGSRLNKMIFITHGTVHTYQTNGKGGKIGSKFLEKGDYYGADELLEWASKFNSFDELPISTKMVKPVTKVEAFELSADDLKSVAIKYWWNFTKRKELTEFGNRSMLEEFALYSIEKEIRRRRQGKKKHSIRSLNKLAIQGGSASQKLQRIISKVMKDQLPSPVGALKDC